MNAIKKYVMSSPERKAKAKHLLRSFGFETEHWVRIVMYQECFKLIEALDPASLDACEISGRDAWQGTAFKSFTELRYPDFDICRDVADRKFDLVIADNVFEHVAYPYRAGRNVCEMLKPGGHFLNITPFLIRVHEEPLDCSRWTEVGMRHLLEECGFDPAIMKSGSWGNRACVISNFTQWTRMGWGRSLKNEPNFPAQVWCLAQKPGR